MFKSTLIKFESNISKEKGIECWIWIGATDKRGRGFMSLNREKRWVRASRISLYLYKNFDLDSKLQVNHKCNDKRCVNPDHLYIGNQADNMKDKSDNIIYCPRGHEYNEKNTYWNGNNKSCKICRKTIYRKNRKDKKEFIETN